MKGSAQLDLLNIPREAPYQPKSVTSREAARKARPKAGSQRSRVYSYLVATPGGATMHEIADALRLPLSSICARCSELRESNLARATDETRPTPNHGKAAVWRVL